MFACTRRSIYTWLIGFVKNLPIFFPDTSLKMAMVSEFLKQAWFIDNEEQGYVVSRDNKMTYLLTIPN
jgi:hypothetical protein